MSIKLYKHLTETNEIVKSTIKTFRKNDNKSRKPQNIGAQEDEIIKLFYGVVYTNLDKR